jgi:hypothetical protein
MGLKGRLIMGEENQGDYRSERPWRRVNTYLRCVYGKETAICQIGLKSHFIQINFFSFSYILLPQSPCLA